MKFTNILKSFHLLDNVKRQKIQTLPKCGNNATIGLHLLRVVMVSTQTTL